LALEVGQSLIVPGGSKPDPVVVPTPGPPPTNNPINYTVSGSGLFARPAAGSINQYASWYHPGVDIGADYGAGVYAAGAGRVITASPYGSGFGMHIFIDHGNGYITAYAHMSALKVNVGQNVSKGQLIGAVGCSGFCTGSHLHFEVRRGGSRINPLSVL
jgi:murein DD-endopeptidase MepM/ murein hydrolase activator NlpD